MPGPLRQTSILIFLKAPRAGFVKTRLAKDIGAEHARGIYRSLVEGQLNRLQLTGTIEIVYTPTDAEDEMRAWLGEPRRYLAQVEGDLGDKLTSAIQSTFESGAPAVICIGGDCPGLNPAHIHRAIDCLHRGDDVVFGPTEDGGYYLVALKAPQPQLFKAISWSTSETLKTSQTAAQQLGLKVSLLEMLYDIDEVSDLNRAIAEGQLEQWRG